MEEMPGRHRRRMMEHMARRRIPPHRMRHMMDMDMDDDDDMLGHPMMLMMMRDREMMGYSGGASCHLNKDCVKTLLQGKWRMVYLKQRLYFCNKECSDVIWSYDLVEQSWNDYRFNAKGKKGKSGYIDGTEQVDIIVMGQTLYLAVLIIMHDIRNDFFANRNRGESDTRDVQVRIKILKLTEEGKLEDHHESEVDAAYVDKSQFKKQPEVKEKKGSSWYNPEEPTPINKGVLKMVLYREDDEKLNIFIMQRRIYKDTPAYSLSFMMSVYLDLKEEESQIDMPHNHPFVREMTPLMNDNVLAIVADDMCSLAFINLATPSVVHRCKDYATSKLDTTHFLDAEALYPLCPSLNINDGRHIWVLEGGDRDVSEMREMTGQMVQDYYTCSLRKKMLPPPPVRCFTMACPGRIERNFLRRFNPPTKYLHT